MHCAVETIVSALREIRGIVRTLLLPAAILLIAASSSPVASAQDTALGQPRGAAPAPRARVEQATHTEPARFAISDSDTPRPLPPVRHDASLSDKSDSPRTLGAIVSVTGSLAVVLGLFFSLTWLMRRGLPSSGRLPEDVVCLLGRTPLAGRQQMHVLRFGNKLLLVCASPSGFETLAEINDAEEVQRLVLMCGQSQPSGAVSAIGQVFDKLRGTRSASKFTGTGAKLLSISRAPAAEEATDA